MAGLAAGEPEQPENLARQNKLEFLISAYKGRYMGTKAYFNITTTHSFLSECEQKSQKANHNQFRIGRNPN